MTNKMCNKQFVRSVFFFISIVLVLVWFKTTTATSLRHQTGGGDGNYKCVDKERDALLHFKSYIHEDPKGFLSTWTPKEVATNDCCKWSGVTCNNQGYVSRLDLANGNLRGEISPSLLNLSYLSLLDLGSNDFRGSIPMIIGSLTRLRYFDLSYNSLTGTIPMFNSSMTQLSYLNLRSNGFTGTIPRELGNLTNLQELLLGSLKSCTLENLDWLSHMTELESLDMSGTSLAKADKWVNVILTLKKLSYLSLSGCDLSHVTHPYFLSVNSSSSILSSLDLSENNLNSSMYHWLFPLTSNRLEDLQLYGNMLDGIPKYLGNLCSLRGLTFYNNLMFVKFPDFLKNLCGCTSVTLQMLDASNSQLTGSLSNDIQKFSSLKFLWLSGNHLNETLSEKVWQLPKLQLLDLSSNSLEGVPSEFYMSNLSDVVELDLSSCKLGPHFPKWIQWLKNLTFLNIANNSFSNTIPTEFWNMWPSQLTYLDLSSNNFYGHIPNVSSTMQRLDLSKNKFYGRISFLCQIVDTSLYLLDLSNNSFTGQIPDCLWHFKGLQVLNLEQNNFSGRLSSSIENLTRLEVLYLYNNNFSGELPISLQNCTMLTFLDLGANKFSGYVPGWIGEKLYGLYALSLTSNNFVGTIPLQLCKLVNLQILDLSMNNLYGTIPSCLDNLSAMVQDGFSPYQNEHYYPGGGVLVRGREYVDHAMIHWQGSVREFSKNLGLLKSIDLSSNNLSGEIPFELTELHYLITLNLSMNSLLGEIPSKIGKMKELQILDLSRNKFSGGIPSSMSQMTYLNYLDVSYNNLSGRIPFSTQLQSFVPSRYTGNARLCGPPLTKYCPGDKELEVPPLVGQREGGDEGIDELNRWFCIGGAAGFATGFWIACGALLLNRRGRHAFFHFLDSFKDWVYVKVMVFIAKLQRVAHL